MIVVLWGADVGEREAGYPRLRVSSKRRLGAHAAGLCLPRELGIPVVSVRSMERDVRAPAGGPTPALSARSAGPGSGGMPQRATMRNVRAWAVDRLPAASTAVNVAR
jgi:hypothetical protein